jgi:DNA-binding Lrp family transcriptional regulator
MKNIDLKDRRILYQLSINSRQSDSKIGKEIRIAKSVVNYRIKNLIDNGIINKFFTSIDTTKLGFTPIRFHFTFQYTNPQIEEEIISYFVNNKLSAWIGSGRGFWDLSATLWIKNTREFSQIWQNVQRKYGHYLEKQSFCYYINEMGFRPTYLLLDNYKKSEREFVTNTGSGMPEKADDTDLKILKMLSINARLPLSEMSKYIDLSSEGIGFRIKQLLKKGIITGFKTQMDLSKLGLKLAKVYIFLKEYNKRDIIINYIKYNPYLNAIDTTTGESHLELELFIPDINKINEIMADLQTKFPNVVKNYTMVTAIKYHKLSWFPDI